MQTDHLFDIFFTYNPIAVGIASNGSYGWVSLPSLSELDIFVKGVDGSEFKKEMWEVISNYDPLVTPMTLDQLSEAKQAAQEAERERKQLERRVKREAAPDDWEDTASSNILTIYEMSS